jgi:poly(hydroxyalkanoate) granule-associated protein
MFETLDKIVAAGLGAMCMTRDRAEELFDEAVKRGKEVQANREKFVAQVMDSAKQARAGLEETVRKQVHSAMTGLNLPTREDLQRIEAKLDQLLGHKHQDSHHKESAESTHKA